MINHSPSQRSICGRPQSRLSDTLQSGVATSPINQVQLIHSCMTVPRELSSCLFQLLQPATNTSSLHHCNRNSRHDTISVKLKIGGIRYKLLASTCLSRSCSADAARNSYQRMTSSQKAPASLLGLGAPTAHDEVPSDTVRETYHWNQ